MKKQVVVLVVAGSIGLAIARRVSVGKHLIIADFLIDGGCTASYFYGDLQYLKNTH